MSIDWTTGSWQAAGDAPSPDFRITVAGDWAAWGEYEKRMIEDPAGIYGDLLPIIRDSDLRIVNVETVLGDRGAPVPKDGPNLRGDAGCLKCLEQPPFDVACLANNHCLDYGPEALDSTTSMLQGAGMKTVGAGLTQEDAAQPLVCERGGVRVGIIDCAEGEESRARDGRGGAHGMEVAEIERQIVALKEQADVVLVIFHGGREHPPVPPPYVVNELRRIAEAGADAVIGHHPHAPQGAEIHNGVPILEHLKEPLIQPSPADHAAGQIEEGFVDIVTAIITRPQTLELME